MSRLNLNRLNSLYLQQLDEDGQQLLNFFWRQASKDKRFRLLHMLADVR